MFCGVFAVQIYSGIIASFLSVSVFSGIWQGDFMRIVLLSEIIPEFSEYERSRQLWAIPEAAFLAFVRR